MTASQLHLRLSALGKIRTWVCRSRGTGTEEPEGFSGRAHTTKLLLWDELCGAAGWQKPPKNVIEVTEESCLLAQWGELTQNVMKALTSLWAGKILKCKHLHRVLTLTHMLKYLFQVLLWLSITKTLPVLSSRIWIGTILPEWLWKSSCRWALLMFW